MRVCSFSLILISSFTICSCSFFIPDVIPDVQKHCDFLSQTYSLPKITIADTDLETKVKIENLVIQAVQAIDADKSINDEYRTLYKQACIEFLSLINMAFKE